MCSLSESEQACDCRDQSNSTGMTLYDCQGKASKGQAASALFSRNPYSVPWAPGKKSGAWGHHGGEPTCSHSSPPFSWAQPPTQPHQDVSYVRRASWNLKPSLGTGAIRKRRITQASPAWTPDPQNCGIEWAGCCKSLKFGVACHMTIDNWNSYRCPCPVNSIFPPPLRWSHFWYLSSYICFGFT